MLAAHLLPLLLLGTIGGPPASALPETPEDAEARTRRRAEEEAMERANRDTAREVQRLAEARISELVAAGHTWQCGRKIVWETNGKCSCPSPFARVPEPAAVDPKATPGTQSAVQRAIDKRARKAANRFKVRG